jgi:hypothetical protein
MYIRAMALPPVWHSICAAADLPAALIAHLEPVLGTTPANRELLATIAARAVKASLDTSDEEEVYHSLDIDLGGDTLCCSIPDDPVPEVPAAFARILALHGRLQLRRSNIDMFHEPDIEDEGWLEGTDLEGRGVCGVMRVQGDMYIHHPDTGALLFLDHVMVDEEGPQPVQGDLASVFLGHVAKALGLR